jgi:RluA family pseudouridine synthase
MDIIYEDDSIIVINKPAGLPVLPDGWEPDAPYLLKMLELEQAQPGQSGQGVWVVHRLDKITSGVMVFARTAEAHRQLNLQFERHETHKVYHALVQGSPKWDEHTARHMLRVNVGHKHRTMVDHAKGKPAVTHFRVLERFVKAALLEAVPETGRTHQVRVHASALGHPLLADALYGAVESALIQRPALHAFSLQIKHPASGQILDFTAPYPKDFKQALARLEGNA